MPKPPKKPSPKKIARSTKRSVAQTSFIADTEPPTVKKQQTTKIEKGSNSKNKTKEIGEVSNLNMATTDQLMKKLDDMSADNAAARVVANESLAKLTLIETEIIAVHTKLKTHDKEIANLNLSQSCQSKDIMGLKAKVNYFEQKELDCKLSITGFVNIPAEQELLKICQILEIPRNSIIHATSFKMGNQSGSFPSNNRSSVIKMLLSFSCKEAQMDFKGAANKYGPISSDIFSGESPTYSQAVERAPNSTLKITNVYSPINRKINWMLHQLIAAKKIHGIRYRNCVFHYQETATSQLVPVSTLENADEIVKKYTDDMDFNMSNNQ